MTDLSLSVTPPGTESVAVGVGYITVDKLVVLDLVKSEYVENIYKCIMFH